MIALAASLLLSGAAAPARTADRHVWPGPTAQQVGACGFRNVSLWYNQALGQYEVIVSGIQEASNEQLACVARTSLDSGYAVQLQAPLNSRYDQIFWAMAEQTGRQEARSWLARRGLLSKLPRYVAGRTDQQAYARQLERMCGPRANGAFTIAEGYVTVQIRSPDHPALDPATFNCLANALWASGLPMGLAGGESTAGK